MFEVQRLSQRPQGLRRDEEVFKGRFGEEPPVRTTIAAAGGIPGDSLVEIDVIAYV
jgi:enamine deaminase RidA (YjgF/YER057c/UK114 family)